MELSALKKERSRLLRGLNRALWLSRTVPPWTPRGLRNLDRQVRLTILTADNHWQIQQLKK